MSVNPPDIAGLVPLEYGRREKRWLDVKDARAPVADMVRFPGRFGKAQSLVNSRVTYRSEAVDQWSKPAETWRRQYGDCEDFAILKRAILIDSGFHPERFFLLVGHDFARQGEAHAVLLAEDAGKWSVLDMPTAAGFMPPVYGIAQLDRFVPVTAYGHDRDYRYLGRRLP